MNPEQVITPDSEFVLRRTQEALPGAAVFFPVAFAFLALLLITLFRREHRWRGLFLSGVIVTGVSAIYLPLAFLFKDLFSWWVILVPFLAVGLVYVALMYYRDAQTVHPLWATLLGLLRCAVYGILAAVFLLPGCQNYETTETHSKVLFIFDVSGSMVDVVDDLPRPGEDPARLLTRQGKVIQFLTENGAAGKPKQLPFLDRVLAKTPVTAYRFGTVVDDVDVQNFHAGRKWTTREDWAAWLKPDKAKIAVPADLPAAEQAKLRARLSDLYDDLAN